MPRKKKPKEGLAIRNLKTGEVEVIDTATGEIIEPEPEPVDQAEEVEKAEVDNRVVTDSETTAMVRYYFSDTELQALGRRSAEAQGTRSDLEEQISEIKKDYAGRILMQAGIINKCSKQIREGYELRSVRSRRVLNFTVGQREYYAVGDDGQIDYSELLSTEELTPVDHQMDMDLADEANAEPEGDPDLPF